MSMSGALTNQQLIDEHEKWVASSAMVCMFARYLVSPRRAGGRASDRSVSVVAGAAPNALAASVETAVASAVGNPLLKSLALLLPEVVELALLGQLAQELAKIPGWADSIGTVSWGGRDFETHSLTREVPRGPDLVPSEILIAGPFDAFPATRRSPATSIEVFVGQPSATDPVSGNGTQRANLAHLPTAFKFGHPGFDGQLTQTRRARARVLSEPPRDPRARAQVTFALPVERSLSPTSASGAST